jgi:hypothetical protein
MKKILTLTAALLVCASMASAGNLNLYTDDCSAGGTTGFVNPCSGNTDAKAGIILAGSVVLASPLASFNVAQISLDVQGAGGVLPAWWMLDGTGCRAGSYTLAFDQNVTPSCPTTLWNVDCAANQCPIAIAQWTQNLNSPGSINLSAYAAIGTPRAFPAGSTEIGVFSLLIKGLKTTGAGLCAGCTSPVGIALQRVDLLQANATDPTVTLSNDHSPTTTACVSMNNSGPCNGVTPTRNATWGSVKALYR